MSLEMDLKLTVQIPKQSIDVTIAMALTFDFPNLRLLRGLLEMLEDDKISRAAGIQIYSDSWKDDRECCYNIITICNIFKSHDPKRTIWN